MTKIWPLVGGWAASLGRKEDGMSEADYVRMVTYERDIAALQAFLQAVTAERNELREAHNQMTMFWFMEMCLGGLRTWREKPYNSKWSNLIEGTPIPNDLPVVMAQYLTDAVRALKVQPPPSDDAPCPAQIPPAWPRRR